MKTINLRWMYPHYRHDEFVDVTDEVWAAMYQAQREMENYERRKVYHRAYYSLDAYSWMENYALEPVSYTHLPKFRVGHYALHNTVSMRVLF